MKIALISAPFGQTGGPELTTVQLADALTEKGIGVSLFAPADFITKAKLVPTMEKSLWHMNDLSEMTSLEKKNLVVSSQVQILAMQEQFDIIHISSLRYSYAIAHNARRPVVVSLHNRMKERDYSLLKKTNAKTIALTKKYKDEVGADAAIYPGLPLHSIAPRYEAGSGLITIGRITDQKGIHVSIEIAKRAKKKLTIVGRIGNSTERQDYYDQYVRPHIDSGTVIFRHDVKNDELLSLIAESEALLFPIRRPETFGRVIAEALSCGTPVIGSIIDPLPELLTDPKVAFLSEDIGALAEAASATKQFDRLACRKYAEVHFDINKCAEQHIEFYQRVLRQ